MKLEFLVDEKNHVEIILQGEDHSFANALREKILEEKGVEFVSVTRPHPTAASPVLVLRTKGKPARELLVEAVKALQKGLKEFMPSMKKSA